MLAAVFILAAASYSLMVRRRLRPSRWVPKDLPARRVPKDLPARRVPKDLPARRVPRDLWGRHPSERVLAILTAIRSAIVRTSFRQSTSLPAQVVKCPESRVHVLRSLPALLMHYVVFVVEGKE